MSFIETLKSKVGVPGRKKYETEAVEKPFAGLAIEEKLLRIARSIRLQDKSQRQRRRMNYNLSALYYQGYQNISFDPFTNALQVYEKDDYYIENQYRRHVDVVKQMLNQLEGDVIARPASDSPHDIATARVSDSVLSAMKSNVGYERHRDTKSLYKCLFGTAFIFSDYVVDKRYGTTVSPKYSYEDVPFGDMGEMLTTKVVDGYDKKNKGSEVVAVCSPLEVDVRADIKGGLEALPWLRWGTRQDTDLIRHLYPGIKLNGGANAGDDNYVEQLANMSANMGDSPTFGSTTETQRVELNRTWIQPCMFQGDKQLLSAFENGVHVVTAGDVLVDYYPENLVDRWTYEVLIPLPHSFYGDGLYDAIMQQDQINELNSLFIAHVNYSTVGHRLYNANGIDPKDVVNHPANGWVACRPALDQSVGDLVKDLPPNTLSTDVPSWLAHVHEVMQDMSSAYDPASGKGLGANTPYSQSVFLSEKAQSRWLGSNTYNKPELIRFNRNLLEIARSNWDEPRRRAFQSETGEWSFEQFSQADLQGQVELVLTDNDVKPKSRAEQVQALTMLVELSPILPMLPPKQKLRIEELLGLPPDANPMSSQISRAYRQIERLKKQVVVTPNPLLDDATSQVPVFKDFLISEAGEQLAEESPEVWAQIFTYMITMLQMGLMSQANPQMHGIVHGQGALPAQAQGTPADPNAVEKPAGGQPGQQGGSGSGKQPNAQSPATPAPPVSPPSPAA